MNRPHAWSRLHVVALAGLLAAAGCAPVSTEPPPDDAAEQEATAEPAREVHPFAAAVEAAHSSAVWHAQDAFAADVVLEFGGNTVYEGRLITAPDAAHTHTIRSSDGAVLVFDGSTAWVSPADAEWQMARFHALTWAYFLAAPHKLADPGANLEELGEKDLEGIAYQSARMTFDPGVGDAPDDWYIIYRNPDSGRVDAMAYIVTFGTPKEKAEAEPHAITYGEWSDVGGVPIPTVWEFRLWSEGQGVHGEPLGRMTLSDPEFVTPQAGAFEAPADAREEGLPEPQPAVA